MMLSLRMLPKGDLNSQKIQNFTKRKKQTTNSTHKNNQGANQMSISRILFPLILLILSACQTTGQPPTATKDIEGGHTVSVFDAEFTFNLPEGWKHAFTDSASKPGLGYEKVLFEFVPEKSSVTDWTDFFVLTVHKGLPDEFPPEVFLIFERNTILKICGKNTQYSPREMATYPSLGKSHHTAIGCRNSPLNIPLIGLKRGMSEIGYYTVSRKGDYVFVLKRSIRGAALSPKEADETVERLEKLNAELMPFVLNITE